MSKHTPGPWKAEITESGNCSVRCSVRCSDSYLVNDLTRSADERASNARLIAAAPEMLDALKMFVAYRESGMGASSSQKAQAMRAAVHDAIEAAIAKVEGNS